MRADRLVAALLVLQARGRTTASALARELEVSVATARRDLEALSAAGIPVYPQPGRGGGWALLGGARTDLTGLTEPEAQALFLLAGPAAAAAPAVRSALRKLVRALPETWRTEAEAATGAVLVDGARWGEREPTRPALVDLLQRAVVRRRKIRMEYVNRAGERGERLVDPLGLVDKDDTWYLVAGTDRGRRTFRVDRIAGATETDRPAERPPGFELATAWDLVVDEMERRRSALSATVLVEPRFLPVLRDRFGRHCRVPDGGTAPADGRAEVLVSAPTARDLARQLAGWGGLIEVVGPASVRTELARIGAELTARYATPR